MAELLNSVKPQVCLTIGGSDSCGGAGIQADLQVFSALGMHACSAITALTAQNHQTIHRIEAVSLAQLDAEMHAIFDAYDVLAVKTGMLVSAEYIAVISACLDIYHQNKPLVVDPVMVSSSGKRLLDAGAIETLKHTLIKTATLLTPNMDEASVFLGEPICNPELQSTELANQLDVSVLLKGGHHHNEQTCQDILAEKGSSTVLFSHPRQTCESIKLHGTGCRLASAIAAYLAQGESLKHACEYAIAHTQTYLHD